MTGGAGATTAAGGESSAPGGGDGEAATSGNGPAITGRDGTAAGGGDSGAAARTPRPRGLATVCLAGGIAGITLVTIGPAVVCGIVGLRRARREGLRRRGSGAARCLVGIGLSVIWAALAVYLIPHLVRAADPGCAAYKGPALAAYNKVITDFGGGNGNASVTADLSRAISALDTAAATSRDTTTSRALHRLTRQLRYVRADILADRVVSAATLSALNRAAAHSDAACGTLRV